MTRILGGDGSKWLADMAGEEKPMNSELSRLLVDMVTAGHTPAAIIMSPTQMRRWLRDARPDLNTTSEGSGWSFEHIPIYRSYEIVGPAVVSRDVLKALRKMGRSRNASQTMHASLLETAVEVQLEPIIF